MPKYWVESEEWWPVLYPILDPAEGRTELPVELVERDEAARNAFRATQQEIQNLVDASGQGAD